jgi:protein SCO1
VGVRRVAPEHAHSGSTAPGLIFWLALAVLVLAPMSAPPYAGSNLAEFAFRPHPGALLPLAEEFVDEQGREARLGQYFTGNPVVLVLAYLRCQTLCGVTLQNLVAALAVPSLEPGRNLEVVVISIDPRDLPTELDAAKAKYRVGNGWHFLTGPAAAVRTVADAVGFPYRYEPALDQYIHPSGFVIAAPDGRISRYLFGVSALASDLRPALDDAARGRSVGLVERFLLLCHGKDSNLGPYSLLIEAGLIIANLAAMAGAAAAFAAIWRRRHG